MKKITKFSEFGWVARWNDEHSGVAWFGALKNPPKPEAFDGVDRYVNKYAKKVGPNDGGLYFETETDQV